MIVPHSRILLAAAFVVLPAATLAGIVPAMALPCAGILAACFAASVVDALLSRQRVAALTAGAPDLVRITKDVRAEVPITLENRSARTLSVRAGLAMPAGIASERIAESVALQPGRSALAWPCTGTTRGDHALRDLHVETPSPLGLWLARARVRVECNLRVYPNLRDRPTAALFLRAPNAGMRVHRQVGKGREFERLREYMPGDSYEDIHWKATAHRRTPVVKLYQVEHAQEVYVLVDASRLSAREQILESYVTAALHLALAAERQGDRFGLITFSDRPHSMVRARSGMDHFRLCRETIYNLQPRRVSPDFRELFTSLQLNLRRRSLLIFFTALDDALLAETFAREVSLVARRHLVLVNVMRTAGSQPLFEGDTPADVEASYRALAGQMLCNKMRELQIALHNRGVRLSVVDPQNIKAQATAAYLEIKRRQLL
ncbi:MAG: DUF58 domain-containing protein [Bryobacteraceae bacterium]|jgi:uncharacterized protein (DUF58 family)